MEIENIKSIEEQYLNVAGDPDEDTNEQDTIESTVDDESGVDPKDLPKFRKLIKEKKTAMKAQRGNGGWVARRKITLPPKHDKGDSISWSDAAILISTARADAIEKKRGWRYYWKQFKNSGGKAQIKQQVENARIAAEQAAKAAVAKTEAERAAAKAASEAARIAAEQAGINANNIVSNAPTGNNTLLSPSANGTTDTPFYKSKWFVITAISLVVIGAGTGIYYKFIKN
jgi:hypothetical protein